MINFRKLMITLCILSAITLLVYSNPPETSAKNINIQIVGDVVLSATNGWCVDTGGKMYTIGEELPNILENILKQARDKNLKIVAIGEPGNSYHGIGQKIQYNTIYILKIGFQGKELIVIPRYHGR